MKNILDPKKHVNSLKLPLEHSLIGTKKEKLKVLKPKVDTIDTSSQIYLTTPTHHPQTTKEISATVEYPLLPKKKIWKDKLSSSNLNSLTTKLSKILDRELISKEKVLTPFWTNQSKVISDKLWLPTKIDYVDSVLNSSKESYDNNLMGKSWFSIKKKHPLKKNSLMTSFQSSQFFLPDSMDSEVTLSKTKLESKPLRTLKIRLFPNKEEKTKLNTMLDQYRWYYNSTLTIVYMHYGHKNILKKNKYSNYTIRDLLRKYEYTEDVSGNLVFKDFVYNKKRNELMVPAWWENNVHSRLPRGASNKFTSSLNSAISNKKNGNIINFNMKYMTKKNPTEYLNFEDRMFPSFISKIKSKYWFTNKQHKKVNISFSDIDTQKRGIEIIHDKKTGKYFLHYPIDRYWYPSTDRRNDSQVKFECKGDRIISLDPGIRKFLVGYDPTGFSVFIGDKASLELTQLLYQIDKSEHSYLEWKKIKNMINELHWKTISFLIENYDTILLPDFRVSQMLRKGKLSRMTKRLMCMFSFHKFREKLTYKCEMYGKKLIIVDESYTSCTCGVCGIINNTKGKEVFDCSNCLLSIDRDATGSRNILIKNTTLRLG